MTVMRDTTMMAVALGMLGAWWGAPRARAQRGFPSEGSRPSREVPGLDRIGIDEKLGRRLPGDAEFVDEHGKHVRLADFFQGKKPILLTFAYHTCPTLCSMVLNATLQGVSELDWSIGDEFDMITISIDPRDTPQRASKKKASLLKEYAKGRAGKKWSPKGWHFLVGSEENIRAATEAAGYRYFYHAAQEQYAHPAAMMFLSPSGSIARYLYGLQFAASDVRLALLEASEGRTLSSKDAFILYCYAYDPDQNGYSLMATRIMQVGGGLSAAVIAAFLMYFWSRERSAPKTGAQVSS